MIRFDHDPNTNEVAIKLSGDNFQELLKAVHDTRLFTFRDEHEINGSVVRNCFVGHAADVPLFIERADCIEPIPVPAFIHNLPKIAIQPRTNQSTEYFRRALRPECIKSDFRGEYQRIDVLRAIRQSRFMFAWEMGLGKTFASITALNHYFWDNQVDRLLVVLPISSLYNFQRELIRFNSFDLSPESIYIADRMNRQPFQPQHQVVMMTYRTFTLLCDREYERVHKKTISNPRKPIYDLSSWGERRAIIFDEFQALRNVSSKQSKWLHQHSQFFRVRFGLSGTPAPNKIEQWYGPIKFLDPTILPSSYYEWLPTIAQIGNRWNQYAVGNYFPERVKAFSDHISKWVSRRFKTECLPDLPPLVAEDVYVPFTKKHAKLYQLFISYDLKKMVTMQSGGLRPQKVKDRFPYLMQAIDNPCLLKGKIDPLLNKELFDLVEAWKFEDHSKIEALEDQLEEWIDVDDQKVIVWSGHPLTLDQLAEHFKKYNPIVIHGQTKPPKGMSDGMYRDGLVETFKTDKKHKLLLASYLVLDSAVNITEAPRAEFFDRSFDLEHTLQAMARNHRIGSTETVFINSLVIDNSIDCLVAHNTSSKGVLNDAFFDLDSLSMDQWRLVFEGDVSSFSADYKSSR